METVQRDARRVTAATVVVALLVGFGGGWVVRDATQHETTCVAVGQTPGRTYDGSSRASGC